jgi:hypothetical protein
MEIMIERKNEVSADRARAFSRVLLRDLKTITADCEEQQKIDVYSKINTEGLKEI